MPSKERFAQKHCLTYPSSLKKFSSLKQSGSFRGALIRSLLKLCQNHFGLTIRRCYSQGRLAPGLTHGEFIES